MTPDTNKNKERAAFEAWAVNEGFQIRRLHNPEAGRDYGIDSAQDAWEGWQARAAKAPAAPGFQQALDIRTAQGWKLGGDKVPVLYTDSINGQLVCRDDVWLCATAAFAVPPAAEPVAWQCRHVTATFWQECNEEMAKVRSSRPDKWEVRALYTAPPAPTEQWVSVADRPLPACATLDVYGRQYGDHQPGRRVFVTYTGTRPLETTEDEEITHYQERPAPPQGATKGAT